MIEIHKKYINLFKEKLYISNYGFLWVDFFKGLIIETLLYNFLR